MANKTINNKQLQRTTKNSPAEDEPQQKLWGTTVTKTSSTRKNFDRTRRKTLRYSNCKPSQPKLGQNQEKRYATRSPRHANKASSTTQTQRTHMTCACTKATYRWTGICPPSSRTMVNTTNANIVTQQRYRRPTRHQRTPTTLETIGPSR